MADRIYGFGKKDVKRIGDVVRRIENQPYPGTPPTQRPTISTVGGAIECIVTTAITACNGTTYGSGAVQLYMPVLNANTNTWVAQPTYAFSNTNSNSNSVLTLNWSVNSGTINTNTHGYVVWRAGVFEWLVGDC